MRRLFYLIVFGFFTTTTFGQGTLQEGEIQGNAGLGFSSWGVPIILGIDYGFTDEISLGGEISYRSKSYSNPDYTTTGIGIAAVGNYHFNQILELPSPWDVYAGISLGFYNWSSSNNQKSNNDNFVFKLQVGGRYFFTDRLGVNLEFGGGNVSSGKFGITYKF